MSALLDTPSPLASLSLSPWTGAGHGDKQTFLYGALLTKSRFHHVCPVALSCWGGWRLIHSRVTTVGH